MFSFSKITPPKGGHMIVSNPTEENIRNALLWWRRWYASTPCSIELGSKESWLSMKIPPFRDGFTRLIVEPANFTTQHACVCGSRNMEVLIGHEVFQNLDNELVLLHPRALWARDTREASGEILNGLSEDFKSGKVSIMTLPQRIIFGSVYFAKTGEYPDSDDVTTCQRSHGVVPFTFTQKMGRARQTRASIFESNNDNDRYRRARAVIY